MCIRDRLTAAVAAAQLALPAGSGSAAAPASAAFVSWSLQTNEVTQLAPGVTQTVGTYTLDGSVSNYWRISFTKDSGAKLRVVLPNDGTSTGLDTVRHMADSAVLHGENVVAAVNGDMYNMSTGEPDVYKRQLMRSAASPSTCPSGTRTTASSATSAPMSARTPSSAPSP